MDLLTHALSGTALATCTSAFVQPSPLRKAKLLLVGTIGGMLPDIDAISMWSRFDAVFGQLFGLNHSGKFIYSSKFWYSHHAFFHSLLAGIVFGGLLLVSIFIIKKIFFKKTETGLLFIQNDSIYFITFVLGFWAHLLGDLPTPSSAWGGIALFFPSSHYVGGYGNIWWWNNYDIFLIILSCIAVNLGFPLLSKQIRKKLPMFSSLILGIGFMLILIQINTREYDYAYQKSNAEYARMEQNSKKEQERILGKKLYKAMAQFDRMLKIYFNVSLFSYLHYSALEH